MNAHKILAVCLGIVLLIAGAKAAADVDIKKEHGGFSASLIDKFDVSPGGNLDMEDLVGDVIINSGNANQVEIIQEFFFDVDTEKEAESAFKRYRARITKSGNRIEVFGNDRDRRRYVTTSYRVKVPRKFNVSVETMGGEIRLDVLEGRATLETLGGDVDVSGVTGNLDVETAGGEITVRALIGEADLETAGGNVELHSARGGPFRLKTAGGEIILRSIEGDVDGGTSGGDMEARQVKGNVDLSTSGGEITLEEVEGQRHSIKTSGGDLEAHNVKGNVEMKTSGGEVIASLIAGDLYGRTSGGDIEISDVSGDVDVSTSGGDLEIEKVTGKLSGKTSGGDVEVRVVGKGMLKAPIRLSTSGGEIVLQLPADVKATVDAEIHIDDPFEDYTIRSDFKLKIEEDVEGSQLIYKGRSAAYRTITATGDINGGGPLIELETSEGDITIEKR